MTGLPRHLKLIGLARFGQQHLPWRDVVVALDQGGYRPGLRQNPEVQLPDCVVDWRTVVVYQQTLAKAVGVFGKAGQVNFTGRLQGQGIEVGQWIAAVVDA